MNIVKVTVGDYSCVDSTPRTVFSSDTGGYLQSVFPNEGAAPFALVLSSATYTVIPAGVPVAPNMFYCDIANFDSNREEIDRIALMYNPYVDPTELIVGYSAAPITDYHSVGVFFSVFNVRRLVPGTVTALIGTHPAHTEVYRYVRA